MYLAESLTWDICISGLSITVFTLIGVLTKSYKHKTDLLLCAWLLLLNVPLLHAAQLHLGFSSESFRLYSNPALNLLQGPILYFYVLLLVAKKLSFERRQLLHLVPFGVFYLLFITVSHPEPVIPFPNDPGLNKGAGGGGSSPGPMLANFGVINGVLFIAYSVATVYRLKKHQKRISGVFSQNNNQISLKWIYSLPALFCILPVLNFANENILSSSAVISAPMFHMLSFWCFIVLLCFFGINQNPVFHFNRKMPKIIEMESIERADSEQAVASAESTVEANEFGMSKEAIAEVVAQMQSYMAREKPYLDPDFSVYSLAEALHVPRRTLSSVLSAGLSMNFYQYVNEYRIDEVKVQLGRADGVQSTILDIAFQSGFKSKSSFNSLFKQHCDVTPSQYRKMARQSAS